MKKVIIVVLIILLSIGCSIGLYYIFNEHDNNQNDNTLNNNDSSEKDDNEENIEDSFNFGNDHENEEIDEDEPVYDETNEEELRNEEELKKDFTNDQINQNSNALKATRVTDFFNFSDDVDEFLKYKKDGEYYGFEDWYWLGCSKFCCVDNHEEISSATSSLKNQGKNTYIASNVVNGNRNNAWVEGKSDAGIGESITIDKIISISSLEKGKKFNFTELVIVNGYSKTEKAWKENNRVEVLKMYYNDKFITDILLQDIMYPQYFDISTLNLKSLNNVTNSFKFEIASVYKGTKYNDTAITGINIDFDGFPCH